MTAFELLIAVAVIAMLASVTFLSNISISDSADAAKIIDNMNTIKKAAIAWYADNRDMMTAMYNSNSRWYIQAKKDYLDEIMRYAGRPDIKLNTGNDAMSKGGYGLFSFSKHRTTWYVGYCFNDDEEKLKEKLKGRAKSLGLHFTDKWPRPLDTESTSDKTVWMHVLGNLEDTSTWGWN